MLGVWMPLCDTSAELSNGPIQMQRTNGHAQRTVLQHFQAPAYLVVDPEEFEEQFVQAEANKRIKANADLFGYARMLSAPEMATLDALNAGGDVCLAWKGVEAW